MDFDIEVARTYAELYAFALSQDKRKQLNVHDLQIAATALVYGHSILTANISDFKNIPSIRVINSHLDGTVHEENSDYSA